MCRNPRTSDLRDHLMATDWSLAFHVSLQSPGAKTACEHEALGSARSQTCTATFDERSCFEIAVVIPDVI
ncbi:hypothetical protein BC834DRAFT_873582 [Gloeopeniophorella convolvens]|nr:hypothetical protein BC834DRAFT_873582 [Gloeopeniophorella convolvens]